MYTALWLEDSISEIPSFVNSVCDALEVKMVFAESISSAKDMLRKHHIDLLLMDIEIAGERMTGIEYARQLRSSQEHYKTPILFVSSYSHLARHLFATIQNCQLLTKPYEQRELEYAMGSALGIYEYAQRNDTNLFVRIPLKRERMLEVDTSTVCYIEFLKDNRVRIQYNYGDCITLNCQRSVRKTILDQIEKNNIAHLVQIYRSIVVNINEIKSVQQGGHEGSVYLFGEDDPKPLGSKYRDNVRNFL